MKEGEHAATAVAISIKSVNGVRDEVNIVDDEFSGSDERNENCEARLRKRRFKRIGPLILIRFLWFLTE